MFGIAATLMLGVPAQESFMCYGRPWLMCPANAAIAYIETPRAGCTAMKAWLAKIDGVTWKGHGQNVRCCTHPGNRTVVQIVRHPISRLISLYNHHHFCKPDRAMFCKAPLSDHNAQDFTAWALSAIARWPSNNNEPSGHFKSQVAYTPKNVRASDVLHLKIEETDTKLKPWMNTVCKDCAGLYKITNALGVSNHNLSVIYNNALLLNKIIERFMEDFEALGYPVIV